MDNKETHSRSSSIDELIRHPTQTSGYTLGSPSPPCSLQYTQPDRMLKLRRMESQLGLSPGYQNSPKITPLTPVGTIEPMYESKTSPLHPNLAKKYTTHSISAPTSPIVIHDMSNIIDVENKMSAQIDEMTFRRKTFWKSCCGVVDRRSVQYMVQVGLGVIVIIFSACQIMIAPRRVCDIEDNTTVFIAIITSIVGWFLPSPQFQAD